MRKATSVLAALGLLSAAAAFAAPPDHPKAPPSNPAPAPTNPAPANPAPAKTAAPEAKGAKIGEAAPAFTLKDSTGQERKLSDFKGKIVVLEWTNTECPVVQACYKNKVMVNAYQAAKAASKSVVWLAINSTYTTNPEKNNTWIKAQGIEYPILLDVDGAVGKLYDARRTPHMFVIDQQGILRYHGAIDNNENAMGDNKEVTNYVVNAVKQIAAGETVAPDHVKPYGCTVKYKPASGG